jgi:putative transposase
MPASNTEIFAAYDIQPSVSGVGNPYDNAKADSFIRTLKQEEISRSSYRNLCQARGSIGVFIETVHNVSGYTQLSLIARLTSTKQH